MKINNEINNLLNKNLTRKQFLQYIGVAFLSIIGISSLISALSKADNFGALNNGKSGRGFGTNKYGR
jgi:hypothetical protein